MDLRRIFSQTVILTDSQESHLFCLYHVQKIFYIISKFAAVNLQRIDDTVKRCIAGMCTDLNRKLFVSKNGSGAKFPYASI